METQTSKKNKEEIKKLEKALEYLDYLYIPDLVLSGVWESHKKGKPVNLIFDPKTGDTHFLTYTTESEFFRPDGILSLVSLASFDDCFPDDTSIDTIDPDRYIPDYYYTQLGKEIKIFKNRIKEEIRNLSL